MALKTVNKYEDWTKVYTDGLKDPLSGKSGVGVYVYT